jgi:hypothetical protein
MGREKHRERKRGRERGRAQRRGAGMVRARGQREGEATASSDGQGRGIHATEGQRKSRPSEAALTPPLEAHGAPDSVGTGRAGPPSAGRNSPQHLPEVLRPRQSRTRAFRQALHAATDPS